LHGRAQSKGVRSIAPLVAACLLAGCFAPQPGASSADAAIPACAGPQPALDLGVEPPRLPPGGSVVITLALRNCGAAPLAVPPSGMCFDDAGLHVTVDDGVDVYDTYADLPRLAPVDGDHLEGLSNATPIDSRFNAISHGVCMQYRDGLPVRFTLAPNETHVERYRWNGTLARQAWCPAGRGGVTMCPTFVRAQAGPHALRVSFRPGWNPVQGGSDAPPLQANATVEVLPAPTGPLVTRLLVVDELDWLNGTGPDAMADFGGHCAPADYALDPPSLTLRPVGNATPQVEAWSLVRDFRHGPMPNHTVTFSADRVGFVPVPPEGRWLPDPWNASLSVLDVRPVGDDVYVSGTLLHAGDATVVRAETDPVSGYHATHLLRVAYAGLVEARVQPRANCL